MRKPLLMLAAICLLSLQSLANTLMITVQDYSFSPSTATIHLGDTVMFMWVNGSHTTTSTNIPSGATAWDHALNSTSQTFMYVPAVVGTYSYKCTPHSSMGMVGAFIVNPAVSVPTVAAANFSISPNPVASQLNIQMDNAHALSVSVMDVSGRVILRTQGNAGNLSIDMSRVPNGVYTIHLEADKNNYLQKIIVSH